MQSCGLCTELVGLARAMANGRGPRAGAGAAPSRAGRRAVLYAPGGAAGESGGVILSTARAAPPAPRAARPAASSPITRALQNHSHCSDY